MLDQLIMYAGGAGVIYLTYMIFDKGLARTDVPKKEKVRFYANDHQHLSMNMFGVDHYYSDTKANNLKHLHQSGAEFEVDYSQYHSDRQNFVSSPGKKIDVEHVKTKPASVNAKTWTY